jgi:hypothetical protein
LKQTHPKTARRIAVGALVACLALGARGDASFAGKGGGGKGGGGGDKGGGKPGGGSSSSSLSVVMVEDGNQDGSPNWGDVITFDISTTDTSEPNVSLTCTQDGVVVYGAVSGYYAGYPWPWTQEMSLASGAWDGGSANCTAVLQTYSRTKVIDLASISFTAGA